MATNETRIYTIEVEDQFTGWRDVIDANLTDEQVLELMALCEPKFLYKHLHDAVVGKCTTSRADGDKYFAKSLELCGFKLSLQVNYYVWSMRDDKKADHHALITEDEFNLAVPSAESRSWIDVRIMYGDKHIYTGQMSLTMVADKFRELLDTGSVDF